MFMFGTFLLGSFGGMAALEPVGLGLGIFDLTSCNLNFWLGSRSVGSINLAWLDDWSRLT